MAPRCNTSKLLVRSGNSRPKARYRGVLDAVAGMARLHPAYPLSLAWRMGQTDRAQHWQRGLRWLRRRCGMSWRRLARSCTRAACLRCVTVALFQAVRCSCRCICAQEQVSYKKTDMCSAQLTNGRRPMQCRSSSGATLQLSPSS